MTSVTGQSRDSGIYRARRLEQQQRDNCGDQWKDGDRMQSGG
jgi:hypothetical protein